MDFWFELASPYSYLSAARIDALAEERDVAVNWRPFLLGPIFAAQGWDTSPFRIYPAKGAYMWRDIERRFALRGLPFSVPDTETLTKFPLNTVAAARLSLIGLDEGWGKTFIRSVYHAEFAEHRDISDISMLAYLLDRAGTDPEQALERSTDAINRPRLRTNTLEASRLGVFGAPSFTVAGELFWGDDRLEDALDWAVNHE